MPVCCGIEFMAQHWRGTSGSEEFFFEDTHDHSKKLDIFWATLIFLPVKENSRVVSSYSYNSTIVQHTYNHMGTHACAFRHSDFYYNYYSKYVNYQISIHIWENDFHIFFTLKWCQVSEGEHSLIIYIGSTQWCHSSEIRGLR